MIRKFLLAASIFASAHLPSYAQSDLTKEELCPDWSEIDPLIECLTVDSYAELAELIQNAPSGSEITLCPFFLRKVTSVTPITVNKGIRVICARTAPDQFCSVIGLGSHLIIDSAEDTLFQGFSFRASNDHAVNVLGDAENSELATHTFCQTSFLETVRSKESRGGALMLEKSSGTVNVVECFFQENVSTTYGAGIYSRADQLNVIQSFFVNNKSNGYGPAIFSATGARLMIKTSRFLSNKGRQDHHIVINSGNLGGAFLDGFDNGVNNFSCMGLFDLADESCIEFQKSPPTPFPTNRPTEVPTLPPTNMPITKEPTNKPTQRVTIRRITAAPTFGPTNRPTAEPTSSPTKELTSAPTAPPTEDPTAKPTMSPTNVPTKIPTENPTVTPTRASQKPTSTPTKRAPAPTAPPSQNPTKELTNPPTSAPSVKPTVEPVASPTLEPTRAPIVIVEPTIPPTNRPTSMGDIISKKCLFQALPEGSECIDVRSFVDFKLAIESGFNSVTFCGGFDLEKLGGGAVAVSRTMDIRCVDQCTFYGTGPFLKIGGISSKIRLQNLKFVNSQDASAVVVSTVTSAAQTTFCDTEFERNHISQDKNALGGAITVTRGSGTVNIVNSTFTANVASYGGAIHSEGFKLNVVGSNFVANNAYTMGNAIFVGNGKYLSVYSSSFILNREVVSRDPGREKSGSSFSIVVEPNTAFRAAPQPGTFVDYGKNTASLSGVCGGTFFWATGKCQEFE